MFVALPSLPQYKINELGEILSPKGKILKNGVHYKGWHVVYLTKQRVKVLIEPTVSKLFDNVDLPDYCCHL